MFRFSFTLFLGKMDLELVRAVFEKSGRPDDGKRNIFWI